MGASRQERRRNQGQNRRIWSLASQLEALGNTAPALIPQEVLRLGGGDAKRGWASHLCVLVSGQTSTSQLTQAQADDLIARMEARLRTLQAEAVGAPAGTPAPRGEALITPAQQEHIDRLVKAVASLDGAYRALAQDRGRLIRWAEHYLGKPWPQTQAEADQAIEAWKSILWRTLPSKAELRAQLKALGAQGVGLTHWEQTFVADGLERGRAWGPLQWAKFYEIARKRLQS